MPDARDLTRFRMAYINERIRGIQRIEHVLREVGLKVTSRIPGVVEVRLGRWIEALLSGVGEPEQLADLAKGRLRCKTPQLKEALECRFKVDDHGLIVIAQPVAHIDTLGHAIAIADERIEHVPVPHERIVELLCTIPGVAVRAAQVLIAEWGLT